MEHKYHRTCIKLAWFGEVLLWPLQGMEIPGGGVLGNCSGGLQQSCSWYRGGGVDCVGAGGHPLLLHSRSHESQGMEHYTTPSKKNHPSQTLSTLSRPILRTPRLHPKHASKTRERHYIDQPKIYKINENNEMYTPKIAEQIFKSSKLIEHHACVTANLWMVCTRIPSSHSAGPRRSWVPSSATDTKMQNKYTVFHALTPHPPAPRKKVKLLKPWSICIFIFSAYLLIK